MKGAYTSAAFINNAGIANVAANASIEVRKETDGTLAVLYADKDGSAILANPFLADANGRFQFFADASDLGYQVKSTSGAFVYTARYQPVGSMQYIDAPIPSAKGQIWASIAAGAAGMALLAAGAVGSQLVADPAETAGLNWRVPAPQVRQTVRFSAVDANGYASFLSAGAALNFNVDANPDALVIDFAAGTYDATSVVSVDAANQGALVASNTNFIYATYATPTTVTWSNCLVPPQYGYAFDRSQNVLLNFEAADATVVMIDDFGNTWAVAGNAQIDTAQKHFGTASLLLDGTGDWISSTNLTTLGDGSWEWSCWFRLNATSGVHGLISCETGAAFEPMGLCVDHNGGSRRIRISLSSNGSSNDIANGTLGTAVLALATDYKVRVVFDALAGTYRVYLSNNGAAETQEITVSSTARICPFTTTYIGTVNHGAFVPFNGWVDAVRFVRAATVTGTQTPSAVAPSITDYPVHFYSLAQGKMFEATAASVSAGTNPTLTQRLRVFAGEQDTNGAAVTATRNYMLRGEYTKTTFALAVATPTLIQHNIGTDLINYDGDVRGQWADTAGWTKEWGAYYFNGATNDTVGSVLSKRQRCTASYETGTSLLRGMGPNANLTTITHARLKIRRAF